MSIEAYVDRVISKIDGEFEITANALLNSAKASDVNRSTLSAGKIDGLKCAVEIMKEEKKHFVQFGKEEEATNESQPLY